MIEKVTPRIRKFKREDIDDILEIEEQAFPKTAFTRKTFLACARNSPNHFVVIEVGEMIMGYIIFDVEGHVLSTAVRAAYRRKGLGRMLFRHALDAVKRGLWLEVRSRNTGAIEFYRRLGMKIVGKIPNYYGNDDAIIMVLKGKDREIPPRGLRRHPFRYLQALL